MTVRAGAETPWKAQPGPERMEISFGGDPVATYVFHNNELPRPYFAPVFAPGAVQVTRNNPPVPGKDDLDHGVAGKFFHPGIWLAFSNINGNDYWRLKAPVVHREFIDGPEVDGEALTFTVHNEYRSQATPQETIANETCRYTFLKLPKAFLLVWDSAISPAGQKLSFGDEEEMGLGIRAATPMAVKHGGRLINSNRQQSESQVWGQEAKWCDYGGRVDSIAAGILLVPDPANPFKCRFHARDTGFVTANSFGQKVFGEETERKVAVEPGEVLRLRFGIVLRSGDGATPDDLDGLAEAALKQMAALPRPASEIPTPALHP